jgi:hypothetical protein
MVRESAEGARRAERSRGRPGGRRGRGVHEGAGGGSGATSASPSVKRGTRAQRSRNTVILFTTILSSFLPNTVIQTGGRIRIIPIPKQAVGVGPYKHEIYCR